MFLRTGYQLPHLLPPFLLLAGSAALAGAVASNSGSCCGQIAVVVAALVLLATCQHSCLSSLRAKAFVTALGGGLPRDAVPWMRQPGG